MRKWSEIFSNSFLLARGNSSEKLDVNDNYPIIELPSNDVIEIPWDAGDGFEVMQIIASDADSGENGRLSYVLQNEKDRFKINEMTGVLCSRDRLCSNDDKNATFEVTVKVSDSGLFPLSTVTKIQIKLSDQLSTQNYTECLKSDESENTAKFAVNTAIVFVLLLLLVILLAVIVFIKRRRNRGNGPNQKQDISLQDLNENPAVKPEENIQHKAGEQSLGDEKPALVNPDIEARKGQTSSESDKNKTAALELIGGDVGESDDAEISKFDLTSIFYIKNLRYIYFRFV